MKIDHPALAQIPALRHLWKEAFGDDDLFLDAFFSTAFSQKRCYVLTVENEVAAALYWFDCQCDGDAMAYLYAVATDKRFRRQGLCRHLIENTHKLLKGQGYAGCILVPGDASLAVMYQAMGYCHFSGMDTVRRTCTKPIPVQKISWEEYAALRSTYLPHRGVAQSGLDFLASSVSFYKGTDFLLAATVQKGDFFVLEMLGNTDSASGVLAALGQKEGYFRIPGSTPFAMYHSLSAAPAPAYFAFAFD